MVKRCKLAAQHFHQLRSAIVLCLGLEACGMMVVPTDFTAYVYGVVLAGNDAYTVKPRSRSYAAMKGRYSAFGIG
jgi:hypothetical protein